MTIKDVIKLLPIDEETKLQTLKMYDYMEPAQKLLVTRIAWRTYFYLKKNHLEINVERQLQKVKEGQGDFGEAFSHEVLKETDQEFKKKLSEVSGSVDLATARQAMHQIIREIQDNKHAKKTKKVD